MGASGKDVEVIDAEAIVSMPFQSLSESLTYTLTGLSVCASALWLGLFQPSFVISAFQRHQGQTLITAGQLQGGPATSSGHFHQQHLFLSDSDCRSLEEDFCLIPRHTVMLQETRQCGLDAKVGNRSVE